MANSLKTPEISHSATRLETKNSQEWMVALPFQDIDRFPIDCINSKEFSFE